MKKILFLVLALVALMPAALSLAIGGEDGAAEKSAFLRFVEDKISTPERRIEIGAIDGALSSDVRLTSITVSDADGAWLKLEGIHLVWSRLALLTGTLDVDSLTADRIEVTRKPLPAPAKAAASEGFSLPELPVAVKIGKLVASRVDLGAALIGEPVALSLAGALKLEGGSLDTRLDVERLDAVAGSLRLDAAYAKDTARLKVDLAFKEPDGGMVSRLLSLPGNPAVDLAIKGEGPIDAFAADVRLATGGVERIGGKATISADTASGTSSSSGHRFSAALSGDIAALVSTDYARYVGGASRFDLDGVVGGDGAVSLDRLEIVSPVLDVSGSAAFASDGFPRSIVLKGRLGNDGATLPLGGADAGTRIGTARFSLAYGDGDAWTLSLDVEDLATASAAAKKLIATGGGAIANPDDPTKRRIGFSLAGRSTGLVLADKDLAEAVGGEIAFDARGAWAAGSPIAIDGLSIETPTVRAGFAGSIDGDAVTGRHSVEIATLKPFSGVAGRPLSGALAVAAEGKIVPMTGAFDLALSGRGDGLAIGETAADGLLAGTSALSGRVGRSTAGIDFTDLKVGNSRLDLALTGHVGGAGTDVRATARIADLSAADARLAGAMTAEVVAKGATGPLEVTARIGSARLGLDGHVLADAALGFTGSVDGSAVDGALSGSGRLDKVAMSLRADLASAADGGRRLSDLLLTAGDTRIAGDVAMRPDGLFAGSLQAHSPDVAVLAPLALVKASGRLDGKIALSEKAGTQAVDAVVDVGDLRVEGNRVGSGHLAATVADALGQPKIDGSFSLADLSAPAGSLSRLVGTATSDGAASRFDLRADGLTAPQLSDNGLKPLSATARGVYANNRVTLEAAKVTGEGGLGLDASGVLPLKGDGLDLKVVANLPLQLGDRLLAARGVRLAGMARADIRLAGSLMSPRYGGSVVLSNGSASDPQTATKVTALKGEIRLDGQSARIVGLSAVVNGHGQVTASGTVGLDPAAGLPVDAVIKVVDTRISDGELVTATVGGDLAISGKALGALGGLSVSGTIKVARAEITVPEGMGSNAVLLDVRHRLPPENVRATLARIRAAETKGGTGTGLALTVDVDVRADSKIFVRGRGLDAELGGRLSVKGTLPDIRPVGGFKLIRGRIDVIGQRITLDEGTVTLTGDLDPTIDFSATSQSSDVSVTASVTGRASDPKIVLSSTPELPQDEILARFLFKRSITDLSPFQIARLAAAVAQLAGGSGNGLLDKLRAHVGLDDLDVTTDAKGKTAVTAGRYISDKVYLGVSAGEGGQTGVSVNLDVTRNLKARAEATTGQSKVGLYFEKEY